MRRREFITLLGGAAAAWPLAARAQQIGKIPLLGILNPGTADPPGTFGFYNGLRELGYTEGQNIAIERRHGDWKVDRFGKLAAELVQLNVDVMVVMSTSPARAAKEATSTIPIVVASMADPVSDGLVSSLARPGGNITGTTFLGPELTAKRMGLLKEAIPTISRIAALWHPGAYGKLTMENLLKETEDAARALGWQLQSVAANDPGDLDSAFSAITGAGADALVALNSPMFYSEHKHIVELAAKNHLPAMYAAREFADAGGLMAYGANLPEVFRRTATYVDKILKGAEPADLPVEQPTKLEFVINLKTAREQGLTIPRQLQLLADEIIE
jgi:putative tryptophan/tyrosine transport system substrate-binding protein